jgi:predicted DsbA family dithiol-disulfide isomerase
MMHIEVISDVICPWCFIGKRHLEAALALLAEDGLKFTVSWRPYQLNPDMPLDGVERAAYRAAKFGSAARAKELDVGVAQAGQAAGLEFHFDRMQRTPNTMLAHRAIRLAGEAGVQDAMVERLFVAYFQQGLDIGAFPVVASLAAEVGVAPDRLAGDAGWTEVVAEDAAARRAGLNGVPSFLMQGYLLFSGAMPAEAMAEHFRKAHAVLSSRAA